MYVSWIGGSMVAGMQHYCAVVYLNSQQIESAHSLFEGRADLPGNLFLRCR